MSRAFLLPLDWFVIVDYRMYLGETRATVTFDREIIFKPGRLGPSWRWVFFNHAPINHGNVNQTTIFIDYAVPFDGFTELDVHQFEPLLEGYDRSRNYPFFISPNGP